MASSSARTWRYNVFASFHGPDVRKSFLSQLRRQFEHNGITMFDDEKIKRGETITPALVEAIRGSRISIVILSKKYASSSWCLNELLEILECKRDIGQIVMTIFFKVDTSDVWKQTGKFGIAFNETCAGKTEEERTRWSKALTDAASIAGYDFKNWDNEAKMIEKIAKDVSEKLNATPSRDFDGMVGLEAHLRKMESLLRLSGNLDATPSMIVGVSGPAGIGKSTIARALHRRHSNKFQLSCFVDNLRESYPGVRDEYSLKLILQAELLSKIFNVKDITINHLGVIQERLGNQRVLIILDDVKNITQLVALANEPKWFGSGSRILITTENKELLQQHGINNMYHVGFPSNEQALEILCRYAFRQSYPCNGFKELAGRVTELCGRLPLGLQVVGLSLRGKNEDGWEGTIRRLDNIFDQKNIEEVLRVGYESLHENEKSLFIHISVFFNGKNCDFVEALFAENNNDLDIRDGLKILANKSLIDVSSSGMIMMHKLLQLVGRKVVHEEESWKRKILTKSQDICDILEDEDANDSKQVSGILFDTSGINEVFLNKRAFKRMPKLRFLKIMKSKDDGNDIVHIPEGMDFPRRLRFFQWDAYPGKVFPRTFKMEYLVELNMRNNQLEKLWDGTQPLSNLKKMDLSNSLSLREIPDLSNATNLEILDISLCTSLTEIPSSFGNLHKLESLDMNFCENLQVVPTHLNLASLESVNMMDCSQLRHFPNISTSLTKLKIVDTWLQELPDSSRLGSRLKTLGIYADCDVDEDIEKLPDWIKDLHRLEDLYIDGCSKLASLPELPHSLTTLIAANCNSLETLMSFPSDSKILELSFPNCFELNREARRVIADEAVEGCLPGWTMPAYFNHRAIGSFLTIRSDSNYFRICAMVSPKLEVEEYELTCCIRLNGCSIGDDIVISNVSLHISHVLEKEHLFMTTVSLYEKDEWIEQENEISFQFNTSSKDMEIIECGVRTLLDGGSISGDESYASSSEQDNDESNTSSSKEDGDGDGSDECDEPKVNRMKT